MKIIFLSTCYPKKSNSSNGIFIHRQAKALQELGVDVHVMQPVNWFPPFGLHKLHTYWRQGYKDLSEMLDEVEGIPVYHPRMFIKMPTRIFFMDGWERMGRTVGKYIKRRKELRDADWIYAHFLCYEGYAGTFASKIAGIPLAAIARGDDVHAWPEKWPELVKNLRVVFRKANLLLANSKGLALDTQKWFDASFEKEVHTIYNGVDTLRFNPSQDKSDIGLIKNKMGLPSNFKFMICLATPILLKGWLEIFDALELLGQKLVEWKLVVVSPNYKGPDYLDLKEEIHKRKIGDLVIFLGQISPQEMAVLMSACDMFVLPSHNEGMSNALLEAMASGLPSIATNVGGHKEIVDEYNGLLINAKSTKELTNAIEYMIKLSNHELVQMGMNARKRMIEFGTYKNNAEKIVKLLANYNH